MENNTMDTQNTNNNNNTNNDVEIMSQRANAIFTAINSVVSTMQDRENIPVGDLAKKVSKIVSLDVKEVMGYVQSFGKNTKGGYIDRGAHGGYIRGTKSVKTIKAGKKTKKTVSA
jgi:hypothetical protein